MNRWILHPLMAALIGVWAAGAQAERRVGVVIGNSAYQEISPLANPVNDARLIADQLGALGFELVGRGPMLDLDRLGIERAIRAFGRELSQPDTVGLFYYAGHGIEYQGKNYLVPVNSVIEREADVPFELVDANLVLQQMALAGNDLNMLILDACRNNPFASRGFRAVGRGLGRMDAPAGTIIGFATRPGDVAADGGGTNSPFTSALARAIQTPNLGVLEVFNKVGVLVKTETGGAQQPWLSSSPIEGQFYFKRVGTATPAPAQSAAPAARPPFDARSMQLEFWQSIKGSDDAADFEAYLAQYPDGTFAALARNRIKALVAARTVAAPTRDSGSTARIAGEWVSEVLVNPFEKSNKYRLHFRFKVIGDRLLGTVVEKSAPGDPRPYEVSRAILDGTVDGDVVTFRMPYEIMTTGSAGNWLREQHSKQLTGALSGGRLEFVLQDDQGYPPQEFAATRAPAPNQ